MPDAPTRVVTSADGTPIAVFGSGDGSPLLLVHGAAADHTTWRVTAPLLADRYRVEAIDRRGRGASGDAGRYAIEREFDDVARVADRLADEVGAPVPVVGHSYGGRVALGAALRTPSISAVVTYEGAPAPPDAAHLEPRRVQELRDLRDAGRAEELLVRFLRELVGMGDAELEAYRANPVWPARVAAAPTIVREVEAEQSPTAGLDALGAVIAPVLQVLGGDSAPAFKIATAALADRLARGRVVVIDGARHAAHHTHPERFVAEVVAFLAGVAAARPGVPDSGPWTPSAGSSSG